MYTFCTIFYLKARPLFFPTGFQFQTANRGRETETSELPLLWKCKLNLKEGIPFTIHNAIALFRFAVGEFIFEKLPLTNGNCVSKVVTVKMGQAN